MNRCLNDLFGYCRGEPRRITAQETKQYLGLGNRFHFVTETITHCEKDKNSCGQFLNHTQLCQEFTAKKKEEVKR